MAMSLSTILGLSRYASATITFSRQMLDGMDSVNINGVDFYFRNNADENDISTVPIGDTLEESVTNLRAQIELGIASSDEYDGYLPLHDVDFTWGATSVVITAKQPGDIGALIEVDVDSYSRDPAVILTRQDINLGLGDTVTFNGVTFTITPDPDPEVLTDVQQYGNINQTYNSLWNRVLGYKYNTPEVPNPLKNIDFSTNDLAITVSVWEDEEDPEWGKGMPISWNLANATFNGVSVGSTTLDNGSASGRFTLSTTDTLELSDVSFPGIPADYTNTDYEAALATLTRVVIGIFANTANPATDRPTVRRQRSALRRLLSRLASAIPTAATDLDNMDEMEELITDRLNKIFIAVNRENTTL